jgi:hypothetical protein
VLYGQYTARAFPRDDGRGRPFYNSVAKTLPFVRGAVENNPRSEAPPRRRRSPRRRGTRLQTFVRRVQSVGPQLFAKNKNAARREARTYRPAFLSPRSAEAPCVPGLNCINRPLASARPFDAEDARKNGLRSLRQGQNLTMTLTQKDTYGYRRY